MKRAIKLVLQALAALFGSLAIVFAVVAWRLSAGPVSLGFLSPYLAEAFESQDLSYRVEFSDTILTWAGWDRSLDIRVRDVKVKDADGALLGTVPELSLGLSGLQLLRGRVSPTVIELLRPRVFVHRGRDGTISFGFGAAKVSGPSDPAFGGLIGGVVAPRDPDKPLGLLREVSVRGADVTLEDESLGLIVQAPKADVVLKRDPRGILGQIKMVVRIGDIELPISGDAMFDHESQTIESRLHVAGLSPARLAAVVPQLDDLKSIDLPLSGEIDVALDAQGHIGRANFDLSSAGGRLGVPGVTVETLDVSTAQARGEISADRSRVRIDDLFLDFGGPSLSFAGLIADTPNGAGLNGQLTLLDLPFDRFSRYWPIGLAPGGREWIIANASRGVMRRLTADLKLPPGRLTPDGFDHLRPGELAVNYEFTGVTLNYMDTLPKVTGVDGEGRTDGLTMTVDMRDGLIGEIHAPTGTAQMADMVTARPSMTVLVELEGDARDALGLLDSPRFRYVEKVGLKPSQVSGRVHAQMGAQFPLLKRLKPEEIRLSADAAIEALAVDGLFSTFKASEGALRVTLDSASGMDVNGTMKLEGVPAKVAWRENFATGAPFLSRYEVSMTLDDDARHRLGIELSPYITGPLPAVIRYTDSDRMRRQASAVLDMREARIELPELYWLKPSGEDANLALELDLSKQGGVEIRNFTLQAKDARFEGNATLDASLSGIKQVEATRMLLGQTDATARLTPAADRKGPMHVEIGGESLDVRPYLKDLSREGKAPVTNLELDLNVKRLITRIDQQVTGARAHIVFDGGGLHAAYLEGTLTSGAPLRLRLEPNAGRRRLVVQSDDAGSVARAFDVYDNAIGGKLYLEANILDDLAGAPVEGYVQIDKYKVRNAPTLANLLAFASLTGIGDVLRGDGLSFNQFHMPFTVFNDLLTIKDAKTAGTSLGLTGSGTVNLKTGETDLKGTIVPAYAVNSVLGSIPLIGDILTGGEEGGGLFAATYTVRGPIDTPTITVNPLAALAPGFLRNLFSIFDGGGGGGKAGGGSQSREPGPPNETDR